jgi:4-aminobutyrate aminotransferase
MSTTKRPLIRTALPGPRARRLLARDRRFISPSYTRAYPLVADRGEGVWIEDVDGNRFLDCTAGIAVTATGHAHPEVVSAARRQMERLIHMSGTDFYYRPQIELAERLAGLMPGRRDYKVFLTNSGAESVEAAFKLARYVTGRPGMIAFRGAFHGRTLGALSLTCSKPVHRRGFAPLVPGVRHVSYPDCYRCRWGPRGGRCCMVVFDELDRLLEAEVPVEEAAAVVVEPIQGEGGYVVPPDGFLRRLREWTKRRGILLVVDEIQSGMGRTGRMFAFEHDRIVPDVVCLAKGIASGFPLGAMIARSDLMRWPSGAHASTFGGNPVACAAALETIRLLEGGLMRNAERVGAFLMKGLDRLGRRYRCIGQVRGRGLMIGVEIVTKSGERHPEGVGRIVQECFRRGLLLLGCGRNTVRFCPGLVITREEASVALGIFERALKKVR